MERKSLITTILVVLSILALIFAGFFVYRAQAAKGLAVEVSAPERVLVGVPFEVKAKISNKSKRPLETVRLAVSLPEDVAFVGPAADASVDARNIQNLTPGSFTEQNFRVIALGGDNTFKRITADATYSAGIFNSQFKKEEHKDVPIGGRSLNLDIATPQQILNGQNFETEVSFKNISGADIDNLKIRVDYPPAFTPTKFTLSPDIGNNVWIFDGIKNGAEIKFIITGNVVGPEGAFFETRALAEALIEGWLYPINSNAATISIARSPISVKVTLNNQENYIAGTGDMLNYTVNYANNTDIGLRDVIIRAQLVGAMFDLNALSTNGAFRSTDNTISWNASQVPALRLLLPGEAGSVSFSLRTKNAYPVKKPTDKDFILQVLATVDSPTVPYFVAEGKTVSFATIENKVRGRVDLDAQAYFRDPASGISNKGPIPLRLNEPTDFTIHWLITNYATDIKDIEVRAFLGGNVRATGIIKSNAATIPTYNERTQELVWSLPQIAANAGVIGKPVEAIFQVEAVPSIFDVDRDMLLIQESSLKATDVFTGTELFSRDGGLTTNLPDDKTIAGRGGMVLQNTQIIQLQQQQQQERQKLLLQLQQKNVSSQEQDNQLQLLEQQQERNRQRLLQQIQSQFKLQQQQEQQTEQVNNEALLASIEECKDEAKDKRDAEMAAANDNHDDDLKQALEKRRNLLILAAVIGDPHLRHIAIVAALKGYEKDEREIEEDWQEAQANANRQYQEDLAECNSAATAEQQ